MLKHFNETGTIKCREGSSRPTKIIPVMKQLIKEQMRCEDETTATQMHGLLKKKHVNLSLAMILIARKVLSQTFRGSAYYQVIRESIKIKRLPWATVNRSDNIQDMMTDECSIEMESHKRHCCRKVGELTKINPRQSIPQKYVHVWAGISWRGKTRICIVEGIMNAPLFIQIPEAASLPFYLGSIS